MLFFLFKKLKKNKNTEKGDGKRANKKKGSFSEGLIVLFLVLIIALVIQGCGYVKSSIEKASFDSSQFEELIIVKSDFEENMMAKYGGDIVHRETKTRSDTLTDYYYVNGSSMLVYSYNGSDKNNFFHEHILSVSLIDTSLHPLSDELYSHLANIFASLDKEINLSEIREFYQKVNERLDKSREKECENWQAKLTNNPEVTSQLFGLTITHTSNCSKPSNIINIKLLDKDDINEYYRIKHR